MLTLNQLLTHSLGYGAILSIVMVGFILLTLYIDPMMWLDDAPEDLKQAVGPMSPATHRRRTLLAIPLFAFIIGLLAHSLVRLAQLSGGALTFGEVWLSTFLIVQIFNVVDLVLVDWLLLCKLQPSFAMPAGAAGLPGTRDYGFHFRGFLKGLVGSAIVCLPIAALAVGVQVIW